MPLTVKVDINLVVEVREKRGQNTQRVVPPQVHAKRPAEENLGVKNLKEVKNNEKDKNQYI